MGASRITGQSPFAFLRSLLPSREALQSLSDPSLNDFGVLGAFSNGSSVLVLGDSITESTGASSYISGYSYMLARSLWNWRDYGFDKDRGFGYQTTVNMTNFASEPGCGWNGTLSTTGVVLNRVSLASGQEIVVSERTIDFADVVYDADASSGDIVISLNSTVVATIPVSGTGLQATGPTDLLITASPSDTITIAASGGTVVVCGVLTWRASTASPTLYIAGKSGSAYQDYTSTAALDELAFYLNLDRSTAEKLVMLNLGTNNIYNSGKKLSPSDMIAQMDLIVQGLSTRCTTVKFMVWVPPRSNEDLFPVLMAGYTYFDYVDAVVNYCRTNNHTVVRLDKTQLNRLDGLFLDTDGLHPNTFGHRMICKEICRLLGVPFNPYVQTALPSQGQAAENRALIPYNDTWRAFSNNAIFNLVAHKNGNLVNLSGIAEPNGSTSTTVGTLPAGYRPINRNIFLVANTVAGPANIHIQQTGEIVVDVVPTTGDKHVSLEGVSFSINSAYGL